MALVFDKCAGVLYDLTRERLSKVMNSCFLAYCTSNPSLLSNLRLQLTEQPPLLFTVVRTIWIKQAFQSRTRLSISTFIHHQNLIWTSRRGRWPQVQFYRLGSELYTMHLSSSVLLAQSPMSNWQQCLLVCDLTRKRSKRHSDGARSATNY